MTIAEDYIPLARNLAKKYTPKGQNVEDSDCMSVAYAALTEACSRLDDRDTGTASYLWKSIEGALKRHLTTQRVQGFSGLKRSKYAEAILMTKEDVDIPEELEAPLYAALGTVLSLDEPTSFDDGDKGMLEETIDVGAPSAEDDVLALEQQAYIAREMADWKSRFLSPVQGRYWDEVMVGDKTQTQFCADHHFSTQTAKKIREDIEEEALESLSYVYHNLEETA